ncbi:uncharacterized protein LOC129090171 isoform X2 [Anoplopoma fimbria]|uniref:uncharacterized protein LOC129090171 isoform X2 n=1 Tax=Anoplopoma fimbria TaxID=229290 RepID=UPI0023EA7AD6|nr:uncharacterized protein LOC129090171 isoform X2 [Anoplopoma fimbria]
MIGGLAALILLCTVYLIQTEDVSHQVSLTLVELGGNVTLECPFSMKDDESFIWYKQPLGYMVQTVATVYYGRMTISKEFNNSRLISTKGNAQYFLTIRNISKEDEATYFCLSGNTYSIFPVNGIFLAVKDHNEQKSFYVKQSPETESVQPGGSVTLQCSLVSKNKENRVQCPGEHSVYWFRSGAREFHPSIIHTHSVKQEERSCDYSLSKTIQNSSDTGTYYCAVVTCGEILFGEGTKVETRSKLELVVIVLGVLLACCVTVIVLLILYGKRWKVCEHCKATSAAGNPGHDKSTVDQSTDLDVDGDAVNYAALNYSTRKVKRVKKRESPSECVYSAVRADYHTQLHL